MGSGLPNLNFEIGFKSHFLHNCPRWYHFTLSFSNAFPMHRAYFRATSARGAVWPVSTVAEFRDYSKHIRIIANSALVSANRRAASRSSILVGRALTPRSIAGVRLVHAGRAGNPDARWSTCPLPSPLRPPLSLRSLPLTPRTAIAAPSYGPAWPTFALHQSPVNLGLAAVGSRG